MLTKSSGFTLASSLGASQRLNSAQQQRSYAFKSVSREKKAAWTNRFVRDSNDLAYDVKDTLVKQNLRVGIIDYHRQLYGGKSSQGKREKTSKKRPMSQQYGNGNGKSKGGYDVVEIRGDNKIRGIVSNRYSEKVLPKFSINRDGDQEIHENPEKMVNSKQKQKILSSNKFGLSDFQFSHQTIVGRFQIKSNHHIAFEKTTSRPININNIWYDRNQDIDYQLQNQYIFLQTSPKVTIRKCHSFKGYSPHSAFSPAESLDKFYDYSHSFKLTKPTIQKERYDIRKREGRKPLHLNRDGTQLQYNYENDLDRVKNRILAYKLGTQERKLKISKQVIDSERGCAR